MPVVTMPTAMGSGIDATTTAMTATSSVTATASHRGHG